jgi:hypothetical protein
LKRTKNQAKRRKDEAALILCTATGIGNDNSTGSAAGPDGGAEASKTCGKLAEEVELKEERRF